MFQPGMAVVEGDPAIQRFVELHFGASEAEAPVLWGDLEATARPLHHVVVADHSLVNEGADVLQVVRSRAPGLGGVARRTSEATVVVGGELAQDGVGRFEVSSPGQTKFTAQAILQHAPQAFDAAFGLGRLGGQESDAQSFQSVAELSRPALSGQLFLDGPVIVVADEDAVAIAIEGQGHAETVEQAVEQAEITLGSFRREELRGQDFPRGVVLHAESREERAATLQPVMRGAIELHEFPFAGRAQTALAMSGQAAWARGTDSRRPQQTAESFAAEREAFLLDQLVMKVMIVEAGVFRTSQAQDGLTGRVGQAAVTGPAAVGVSQSRCAALPVASFEALDVPRRKIEQLRGSGTRQVSLHASRNDHHSLQFLLTQRDCLPVHGVTFSRCC